MKPFERKIKVAFLPPLDAAAATDEGATNTSSQQNTVRQSFPSPFFHLVHVEFLLSPALTYLQQTSNTKNPPTTHQHTPPSLPHQTTPPQQQHASPQPTPHLPSSSSSSPRPRPRPQPLRNNALNQLSAVPRIPAPRAHL